MSTINSEEIGVSSFTPSKVDEIPPPFGTVTSFGAASGVGPSMSVSVAVAPTSPFSSETSTTTSIGRVVSVCGGACTALTMRSGRKRAIAARRNCTSSAVAGLRTCTPALTVAPRATGPRSISATPSGAATFLSTRIVAPFTETWTYVKVATAGAGASASTSILTSPPCGPVSALTWSEYGATAAALPLAGIASANATATEPTAHASRAARLHVVPATSLYMSSPSS